MSGGRLVVLDRAGGAVKWFALSAGLATLGSRAPADIRIMLPRVCAHHATVAVHNSQTVIRNVGSGETLVNGESVSVAALRHGDVISIGDRQLRWEYSAPQPRHHASPGLRKLPAVRARAAGDARRASAGAAPPHRDRALQLAIEMSHRASMPASSGGKQVAIVQPQRRDNNEYNVPENTTQATLWIESRKSSPRRRAPSPSPSPSSSPAPPRRAPAARRTLPAPPPARRSTPLRLTVLRRVQSATKMKVVKIEAPSKIDHTKQAAIMLMTRHTPRARLSPAHAAARGPRRPAPARAPRRPGAAARSTRRGSPNNSVLEITDSDSRSAGSASPAPLASPALPTPKKSALKDFSKKSARKTESIKFDLSNLESHRRGSGERAPSPRRSSHSRSARLLQRAGAPPLAPAARSPAPASPGARPPGRGSLLLQRALDAAAGDRTRTLSPRSDVETFSIVDLVSVDSEAGRPSASVYDSLRSASTTFFETPDATGATSRSTLDPSLVGCSTPYESGRPPRSSSTPQAGGRSTRGSGSARRSRSLCSPRSRGARTRSRITVADSLPLDETQTDDSPRSSRRTRASAPDDTVVPDEGASTPENRLSPVDAGTPVLNIQSLLDSSRSSSRSSARRGNDRRTSRRKTVGVPSARRRRSGGKSKSLGAAPARRAAPPLGAEPSRRPVEAEDEVTPRAAVRLDRQAVKNQHSTAKQPQSRRSIIDDLDRSDIVKQLFNSPVKRKLSRSMTDFERRYEEAARGADDSLSDVSATFTPERFVSPIGSRGPSPDLSAIKRLFDAHTEPERSAPRTRRSIKNELEDVAGLQAVFPRAPADRLSDVRVKELFARAPRDDLRRVSGLRDLFRGAPADDLTDVAGLKRILGKSPRNDLTDVRGVRRMFGHGTRKRSSPDVSGVEELFEESRDPEASFDRLVGRPSVRKVYSRTFSARASPPPARALRRSLPAEGAPLSVRKEMQKLATSTVAGSSPLRSSRTRHSSLKQSAAEASLPLKKRSLCSPRPAPPRAAPRLPLKKRAVLHSTPVKGRDLTMNASELGRVSPIHPLDQSRAPAPWLARTTRQKPEAASAKGASPSKSRQKSPELGPEAAPSAAEAPRPKASPKEVQSPPRRATRNRKNTAADTSKRRPSLVIGKRAPAMSPPGPRPRRAARAQPHRPSTPAKRSRVAKAGAAVLPKPSPARKPRADRQISPPEDKPKRTRRNVAVHTQSPKESRPRRANKNDSKGKENKTDNVMAEKPKRGRKPAAVEVEPPATRRARGKAGSKPDEPEVKPPKGRAKRTGDLPPARATAQTVRAASATSRGKKTAPPPLLNEPKKRGKKIETQTLAQPEPAPRGRRARADKENDPVISVPLVVENRRKRKTVPDEEVPAKVAKTDTRRGRKGTEPAPAATRTTDKETRQGSKTRAKKVKVVTPAPAKPTRGRKIAEPKGSPVAGKRKRETKVEAAPAKGKKPTPNVAKKARLAEPAPAPATAGRTRARAAEAVGGGRSRRR